jgi:hypothetical protein
MRQIESLLDMTVDDFIDSLPSVVTDATRMLLRPEWITTPVQRVIEGFAFKDVGVTMWLRYYYQSEDSGLNEMTSTPTLLECKPFAELHIAKLKLCSEIRLRRGDILQTPASMLYTWTVSEYVQNLRAYVGKIGADYLTDDLVEELNQDKRFAFPGKQDFYRDRVLPVLNMPENRSSDTPLPYPLEELNEICGTKLVPRYSKAFLSYSAEFYAGKLLLMAQRMACTDADFEQNVWQPFAKERRRLETQFKKLRILQAPSSSTGLGGRRGRPPGFGKKA